MISETIGTEVFPEILDPSFFFLFIIFFYFLFIYLFFICSGFCHTLK